MDFNPLDQEEDRLESTWDRWQRLPLAVRANAFLYVLGFISLVVLLAQVVTDESTPTQLQVATRAPTTTRPLQTTTSSAPTTLAPTVAPPNTTPTTPRSPSVTAKAAPTATAPSNTNPVPGLDQLGCVNSTEPRCGDFHWDPDPGPNLPIVISIDRSPSVAGPGVAVSFAINVSDGDHPVSDNCAVVNFGDGISQQAPCSTPACPQAYGAWNTPPRRAGSQTFNYSHAYAQPGAYTVSVEFHTDRDTCPDPYGNFGQGTTSVTISSPPGT